MDKQTIGWKDKRTENLPILQDFVPYQGRCPKKAEIANKIGHLERNGQLAGKSWIAVECEGKNQLSTLLEIYWKTFLEKSKKEYLWKNILRKFFGNF